MCPATECTVCESLQEYAVPDTPVYVHRSLLSPFSLLILQSEWTSIGVLVRFTRNHFLHASRGVVLLVYSPILDSHQQRFTGQDEMDQDMHAQQYEAKSEFIMKVCIRPWLRMVHSITPGAHILVICSHLESPPQGGVLPWSQHVQRLAGYVHSKVHA